MEVLAGIDRAYSQPSHSVGRYRIKQDYKVLVGLNKITTVFNQNEYSERYDRISQFYFQVDVMD